MNLFCDNTVLIDQLNNGLCRAFRLKCDFFIFSVYCSAGLLTMEYLLDACESMKRWMRFFECGWVGSRVFTSVLSENFSIKDTQQSSIQNSILFNFHSTYSLQSLKFKQTIKIWLSQTLIYTIPSKLSPTKLHKQ